MNLLSYESRVDVFQISEMSQFRNRGKLCVSVKGKCVSMKGSYLPIAEEPPKNMKNIYYLKNGI